MKLSFLKSLIELVESSDIEGLEFSRWWTKVKITKSRGKAKSNNPNGAAVEVVRPAEPVKVGAQEVPAQPKPAVEENLTEIKSQMVGTFYRSPSPGAKPYVEVGDTLQRGQVVCIIEAMKLMNEVESEVAGRIAKVLAEDGQPVEYGQSLFLVSPV
jgi:acetyl-CoA carboxylase biotin carboxyl carrier protein